MWLGLIVEWVSLADDQTTEALCDDFEGVEQGDIVLLTAPIADTGIGGRCDPDLSWS